jgi:hypothetical protein
MSAIIAPKGAGVKRFHAAWHREPYSPRNWLLARSTSAPGSKTAPKRHSRLVPRHGHHQVGPVGPVWGELLTPLVASTKAPICATIH